MKNTDNTLYEREDSLVGFSNSILKAYGAKTFHPSSKAIDEVLKGHRKICVFLFDGAGYHNLRLFPETNKFVLDHYFHKIYSTNPATTVAATNAFLTAKWPMETGWLGWSEYFEELGYPLNVFPDSKSWGEGKEDHFKDGSHYMDHVCPLTKIDTYLKEVGVNAKLSYNAPIEKGSYKSFRQQGRKASKFFKNGGEFLYSYINEPDHTMHGYGVSHKKVEKHFKKINKMLEKFVKKNPDVLVITMADHGLLDIHYVDIGDKPEITECLSKKSFCIEGRNAAFWVKEDKRKDFEEAFKKDFPNFRLFTKEEVISQGYFGEGEPNKRFESFLGDYQALAVGSDILYDSRIDPETPSKMKGHHAGGVDQEREISLSVYNR